MRLTPSYMGTFTGARRHVLHTFAHSQSALMKKRVAHYMVGTLCPVCQGKRLKPEALSVTFAGRQPATELTGGEAHRIKLATELQHQQLRGGTLYVLVEPTTGQHPADVDHLLAQLDSLVEAGNTVVVVEHEMRVVAACDWVIDIGPGAGEEGGRIVAQGAPAAVAVAQGSRTAPYLAQALGLGQRAPT